MPWALLFIAGLFEVAWAIGLKYTEGFSKPIPTVLTLAAMAASFLLLGLAMKSLPVGLLTRSGWGWAPWARPFSAWCCSTSRPARGASSALV
jgi:hypothetical protein